MMDLPKDTVIYNEEQTKKIMDNKIDAKVAKSYANGTTVYEDGTIIRPNGDVLRPLRPGDSGWDLYQAGQKLIEKWKESGEEVFSNAYFEHTKQMEKWTKEIMNNTAINNVVNNRNVHPNINIGDINVTCPGVTSQEVMKEVGDVLGKQIGHLSQRAIQEQLRDY